MDNKSKKKEYKRVHTGSESSLIDGPIAPSLERSCRNLDGKLDLKVVISNLYLLSLYSLTKNTNPTHKSEHKKPKKKTLHTFRYIRKKTNITLNRSNKHTKKEESIVSLLFYWYLN